MLDGFRVLGMGSGRFGGRWFVRILRFLGCWRIWVACFCRNFCLRRLLYFSWLFSFVWCCRRVSLVRVRCIVWSCRSFSFRVVLCCRSSNVYFKFFCVCFLFKF